MAAKSMAPETNNLDSLTPVKSVSTGNAMTRSAFAALIGFLGALLAWKVIEAIGEVFTLPTDLASLGFGSLPSPEDQARLASATLEMNLKNAAIWTGAIGAVLGLAFSMAVCVFRRQGISSIRKMSATVFFGAVFGIAAGAVGIWLQMIARQNIEPGGTSPPEQFILLMHGAMWLICGLGIGMGLSLQSPNPSRSRMEFAVVVGLVGMVGGCLFPILAGLLLPAVNSSWPIPSLEPTAGRILWLSLPSVLMGLTIGRSG